MNGYVNSYRLCQFVPVMSIRTVAENLVDVVSPQRTDRGVPVRP
jgi:hypothetical protein